MGIVLNRFNERQITPIKDVMLFEKIFPTNGIIQGCALTHLGSNQVSIAAGTGIIQGRDFTVTAETLLVQLASAGTMPGRIYIRYNLSDTVTPAQILSVCASSLPVLIQDSDFNIANGIWEEELATYSATTTVISGLTTTIKTITNPLINFIKNVNTITEEGYVVDARQLNPDVSGSLADRIGVLEEQISDETVLWTNPNPTSAFLGGNITISETIANFTKYEILYKPSYNVNYIQTTGKLPIAFITHLVAPYNKFIRRSVSNISGTTFVFTDGVGLPTYDGTPLTDNNLCIPYQIIGYK